MNYKVIVEVKSMIPIDASSPEQAVEMVKNSLIASRQIKEADPYNIYIAEEQTEDSSNAERSV